MTERFRIVVDLGPQAPIEQITETLNDFRIVSEFASRLDSVALRNYAAQASARQRDFERANRFINAYREALERNYSRDKPPWGRAFSLSFLDASIEELQQIGFLEPFPRVEADFLRQQIREDPTPRVESIEYYNPLDFIMSAGTIGIGTATSLLASIKWILPVIQRWGPDRDKIRAEAEEIRSKANKTDAEAEGLRAEANRKSAEADDIRSQTSCRERILNEGLTQMSQGNLNVTASQFDATLTDETTGAILRLARRYPEISDLGGESAS